MTTHQIYLGLGSNVEREIHLEVALKMLEEHLHSIRCSPTYESISLDGDHPPFFNLVVSATTTLSAYELIDWLKEIERLHGRRSGKQRIIALDIDLLLFDDFDGKIGDTTLPRPEILTRSYVLYPLQQLAPKIKHPKMGKTLAELWHNLKPAPTLQPVRYPFGISPFELINPPSAPREYEPYSQPSHAAL